jgi:Na+/proline symporter
MASHSTAIPLVDLVIIVAYILLILAVGLWSARRSRMTSQVFFLAGRSLAWPVVGAALFASNISTIHLVGLTASGYSDGLVWGNFEWMASFTLVLLSLIFAPFYFRSRIGTLPEFLERRYSPASRSILAFMAILAALFIHIGMSLYAGAVVFHQFFNLPVQLSVLLIAVIISIYTIVGGLKAVVVTETLNTCVLLFGICLITFFAIRALPAHGIHSLAEFRAATRPNQLHVLQTHSAIGLNWYAVFLGYPILGIWYWCTDQTIFAAINIIASDLAPPITTVFLFGVFWKRGTYQASIATLIGGLIMGIAAFIVDLPVIGSTRLLSDQLGISFLMQAWWMFCLCSLIYIVVSLATPPPRPEAIEGLTWPNPIAALTREPLRNASDPRIMAAVLLSVLIAMYAIFH